MTIAVGYGVFRLREVSREGLSGTAIGILLVESRPTRRQAKARMKKLIKEHPDPLNYCILPIYSKQEE